MWLLHTIWSSSGNICTLCLQTNLYLQILCWCHFQSHWLTWIFPSASLSALVICPTQEKSKSHRKQTKKRRGEEGKKCKYSSLKYNVQIHLCVFFLIKKKKVLGVRNREAYLERRLTFKWNAGFFFLFSSSHLLGSFSLGLEHSINIHVTWSVRTSFGGFLTALVRKEMFLVL